MQNHYLIHLPHCGLDIPSKYLDDYYLQNIELQDNIYQYCDLYTDELFEDFYAQFGGVKSKYSRLFFDPERFGDDNFENMHKKFGLGWFYENAILSQKPLRSTKNKTIIRDYFDTHHKNLNQLTQEKLDKYDKCTVLDCHSFSNERYWFHDKSLDLPDICIGYEDFHKDEELVNIILEEFSEYSVGVNIPYTGSLVPTEYWQKDTRVKSVMIEINKKLYLQEDNKTKNENFLNIKQKLQSILTIINQ